MNCICDFMKKVSKATTYKTFADVINVSFINYTGAVVCWCELIDIFTNQIMLRKMKTASKLTDEESREIQEIRQVVIDLQENFQVSDVYEYLSLMSCNNKIFLPIIYKNKFFGYVGMVSRDKNFCKKYISDAKILIEHINSRLELVMLLEDDNRRTKARSEFLANISLELKTPLNAIMGFSDILSQRVSIDDKRLLDNISQSSIYLNELVQSILDYSDYKQLNLQIERIRPKLLILDILNSFESVCKDKNIRFNYTLSDIIICADRIRIKQVMFNLISNAVKFTKENTVISLITYVNENNEFVFEIKDMGNGLSKKDLSEMFSFFTPDNFIKKQKGSGIGLALCRRILQAHNGDIYVKSKLREGSTFYFSLPLKG